MLIKSIEPDDWEIFSSWAKKENWSISFQEQGLFQNQWRPHFYALWDNGSCCGFMSVVIYKTSCWIGNLIVDPHKRGNGYGTTLFDFAMKKANQNQMEYFWLTASEQGSPLYRRRGFVTVDRIVRWMGIGTGQTCRQSSGDSPSRLKQLINADYQCWKESRAPLLNLLADDGIILKAGDDIALLQPGRDFWQVGPWLSTGDHADAPKKLLDQITKKTPDEMPIIIDIVESSGLELPLRQYGFKPQDRNQLMVNSNYPLKSLSGVNALASLGSIG